MVTAVKRRRRYRSPRRAEGAQVTRRAVLDAGHDLFVGHGYVGTTIQAIAERAHVSPATVYGAFATKRGILSALVDRSIAGDDAPVPILDRPWVREMQGEPDLRRRVAILARHGRLILERRSAVDEVVRAAAAADDEIAELWAQAKAQRYAGQKALLQMVAGSDRPLAKGAADALYAIGSPETYQLLVRDRGWSATRFENWYAEAIARLLGGDTRGAGP
jgi:AcrR family transcriptional regulator